jgi:hypothetical protein
VDRNAMSKAHRAEKSKGKRACLSAASGPMWSGFWRRRARTGISTPPPLHLHGSRARSLEGDIPDAERFLPMCPHVPRLWRAPAPRRRQRRSSRFVSFRPDPCVSFLPSTVFTLGACPARFSGRFCSRRVRS